MKQIIFFRFGHDSIFIPWSDIKQEKEDAFWSQLSFERAPEVKFRVRKQHAKWIMDKRREYTVTE